MSLKEKTAENEADKREEWFQHIIENAPIGYYRVGKDGLWQYVNSAWERMHGYTFEEVVGKPFELTQCEDQLSEAKENMKRVLSGESISGEFSRLQKDGTVGYHSFTLQPVRHKREIVAVEGFINDITAQKEAESRNHQLTRQLIRSQEKERNMISLELHDSIAQDLVALRYFYDLYFDAYRDASPETRKKALDFRAMLDRCISEIRNLAYDLRPPSLSDFGLRRALNAYAYEFSERTGLHVDFDSHLSDGFEPEEEAQINLYRIVQEGLNNVKKHAQAEHVKVRLRISETQVTLLIEDDGRGFDVKAGRKKAQQEKRLGIYSMEERTFSLGGRMTIHSEPEKGTRVLIEIPR